MLLEQGVLLLEMSDVKLQIWMQNWKLGSAKRFMFYELLGLLGHLLIARALRSGCLVQKHWNCMICIIVDDVKSCGFKRVQRSRRHCWRRVHPF